MNNSINNKFNDGYKIISGIVRMALAVWVALGIYNNNLNIVLLYVFEAECILRLVKNLLVRFTNGQEFQEAVKAVEEMNDAIR